MKKLSKVLSLFLCLTIALSTMFCVNIVSAADTSTDFKIDNSSITVRVGNEKRIKLTGVGKNVTFKSYNTKVAKVNSKGVVTGKKVGNTKVRVKSGSVKKYVKVTVKKSIYPKGYKLDVKQLKSKITLNKNSNRNVTKYFKIKSNIKELYKKKKCSKKVYEKLKNIKTQFTYNSSDRKIVGISDKGTLVPKKKGKATITVTNKKNKKKYIINATVTKKQWGYVNYLGERYKMKYVYNDKELVDAFVDAYMNYDLRGYEYPYIGIHCEYDTNVKNGHAFYNKIIKLVSARNATLLDCSMNDRTFYDGSIFDSDDRNQNVRNFFLNTDTSEEGKKLYSTSMDILNKANLTQYTNVDDKYYAIFDWVATNIKYDAEHAYSYKYSILNKKGVCADYAAAYQYLCLLAGLENRIVDNGDVTHEWNVIKTSSGKWYNSDATNKIIMFGVKDYQFSCYKDYVYVNNFNRYTVTNYNTDFYYYENSETHFKLSKDSKFYKYL